MKKPILIALAILWSWAVFAQVTLSIPEEEVDPSEIFTVPVTAAVFSDVASCQFALQWDPTVIQFLSLQDLVLEPSTLIPNFDTSAMATDQGRLVFVWIDEATGTVTLPAETDLFKVTFQAIGPNGSFTGIEFADTPTSSIDFTNGNGEKFEADLTNGMVSVGSVNTKDYLAEIGVRLSNPIPNPSNGPVTIAASFDQPTTIRCELISPDGRLLENWTQRFSSGQHQLVIPAERFTRAGKQVFLRARVGDREKSVAIMRQ